MLIMSLQITSNELQALKARLKIERRKNGCPRAALKINVILALAKGISHADVAYTLEIDFDTVRNYLAKYNEGKLNGLLKDGYLGKEAFLNKEQQESLKVELRINLYQTTSAVQRYVEQAFDVTYSRSGMTKLLHSLGFSYKKPKKFTFKTSPEEQKEFLNDVMEPLLSEKGSVNLFMDASHPTISTETSYGWFETGKETVLKEQGSKSRLNILGSVAPEGGKLVIDFPEKVDSDSIVDHISKIVSQYGIEQKINIFCDNGSANVSAAQDPIIQGYSNVKIVFLPSYSPNLNLAERLWGLLKKQVVKNHYFEDVKELKDKIHRKICRWRTFTEEIRDIFLPKFHIFNRVNEIST